MGKLIALIAVGFMAVGGGAYGLYAYTDVFQSQCDHGNCEVAHVGGCCNSGSHCTIEEENQMQAAVALAGPAGVAPTTTQVSEIRVPCCAAKEAAAAPK